MGEGINILIVGYISLLFLTLTRVNQTHSFGPLFDQQYELTWWFAHIVDVICAGGIEWNELKTITKPSAVPHPN